MLKITRPSIPAPVAIAAALLLLGGNSSADMTGSNNVAIDPVASTAASVAGHVPSATTAPQAAAVAATTSTQGPVSVGDAANGHHRQITGVAAGSADSDAVSAADIGANAAIQRPAQQIRQYVSSRIMVEAPPRFTKDLRGIGAPLVARVELGKNSLFTLYTEAL